MTVSVTPGSSCKCHGFSLSDFLPKASQLDFVVFHVRVSPGILPGRLISASFPPLGTTSAFCVYTSTELAHC